MTREETNMRDALMQIAKIANIPPADDRCGSLAVRMEKVWLLARGYEESAANHKLLR